MPPTPKRKLPARAAAPPAARPRISADDCFADLASDVKEHGKFLMLYSEAGEGKTTLAAQFPAPVFVTTAGEQGAHIYKQNGSLPQTTPIIDLEPLFAHSEIPAGTGHPGWNRLIETMERFRDAQHQYQTLIIDSCSGLQDLCFQHGASLLFNGEIDGKEFTDFYRGYSKSSEAYWSGVFLPLCLQIVSKGLNVILIAHSTFKTQMNPVGPDYDQFRPALMKSVFEYTKKDLHGIFFLGREVAVSIDQKTKKKQTMGDRRFIGLSPSTYYVAKSWCTEVGLDELDCGDSAQATYAVLSKALGM